jgi:oxaloacetate decarboxylase (Na+ extruding) subunit gamma
MTISQMLSQSLILTLLGMGVVFSFLVVMIFCMYLLHTVIHAAKLDGAGTVDTAVSSAAAAPAKPAADSSAVIAAIATALHEKN